MDQSCKISSCLCQNYYKDCPVVVVSGFSLHNRMQIGSARA